MVWPPGQRVGTEHSLTGSMAEGKVESTEEQRPAGLLSGEFLGSAEIGEVEMVGPYFYGFRMAFEVLSIFLKCTDDGKQLFVVNFVVAFGLVKRLGIVRNRVPELVITELFKNCTGSEV